MATLRLPSGTARVTRDAQGVPAVATVSRLDAAHALGQLHATDRLVQCHVMAQIARGRSMETFGDKGRWRTVDRIFRRLELGRDADSEVARVDSGTLAILSAYCDGFNRAASGMSLGLLKAGLKREAWTPTHVLLILRSWIWMWFVGPQSLAEEILASLAMSGTPIQGLRALGGAAMDGFHPSYLARVRPPSAGFVQSAWVARTQAVAMTRNNGRRAALLVCDLPGEVGTNPPLYYPVALGTGAQKRIAGMTLPGVPFVLAGQNDTVAWGPAPSRIDSVDTLVERVRSGLCEAGRIGRVRLRRATELVEVRKGNSERWEYLENEFGLIEGADPGEEGADLLCTRWAGGWGHGHETLDALALLEESRTVDFAASALQRMRQWSASWAIADRTGRIGRVWTGNVDRRTEGWSGLWPRPAWADPDRNVDPGAPELFPVELDPASGVAVAGSNRDDALPSALVNLPDSRDNAEWWAVEASQAHDDSARSRAITSDEDPMATAVLRAWSRVVDMGDEAPRAGAPDFHARWARLRRGALQHVLQSTIEPTALRELLDQGNVDVLFGGSLMDLLTGALPELLPDGGVEAMVVNAIDLAADAPEVVSKVPLRGSDGERPGLLQRGPREVSVANGTGSIAALRSVRLGDDRIVVGGVARLAFDLGSGDAHYGLAGGADEGASFADLATWVDGWARGKWTPFARTD